MGNHSPGRATGRANPLFRFTNSYSQLGLFPGFSQVTSAQLASNLQMLRDVTYSQRQSNNQRRTMPKEKGSS